MNKCEHCGNYHEGRCPQVKAIEYFPDGTIKRVEYLIPGDYVPEPERLVIRRAPQSSMAGTSSTSYPGWMGR